VVTAETKHLVVEDRGPVVHVTMNRPERHNAINTEMGDELVDTFTRLGRDPRRKVIVLKGAGASFCSGDDRTEGAGGRIPDFPWDNPYHSHHVEPFGVMRHGYFQLIGLIRRVPQIVIAQVHGYVMGSGFDLMLAADFAIAQADARLHIVFGARAITGGTALLPKLLPLKQAMEVMFAKEPMSAERAVELGLINRVSAPDRIEQDVQELADYIASIGEQAYGYLGLVKEAFNRSALGPIEEDVRSQILYTRLADYYRQTHSD
jgi:enoyl-CoA hydratase/carnithine racemase